MEKKGTWLAWGEQGCRPFWEVMLSEAAGQLPKRQSLLPFWQWLYYLITQSQCSLAYALDLQRKVSGCQKWVWVEVTQVKAVKGPLKCSYVTWNHCWFTWNYTKQCNQVLVSMIKLVIEYKRKLLNSLGVIFKSKVDGSKTVLLMTHNLRSSSTCCNHEPSYSKADGWV